MSPETPQLFILTEVETTATIAESIDDNSRRGERIGTGDIGGSFGSKLTEQITTTITRKRIPLDAVALKAQMDGLLQVLTTIFDQSHPPAGLTLDEVELSVEINGQGQVSILGSGGTLSNRGAINLKFKRVTPPSSIDQG
jgi:hypothetical protein